MVDFLVTVNILHYFLRPYYTRKYVCMYSKYKGHPRKGHEGSERE